VHEIVAGNKFHGLAVKLTHSVAVSWDGRVLRHCTSMCEPKANDAAEQNLLFGSFTAAKFRVLQAGTMQQLNAMDKRAFNSINLTAWNNEMKYMEGASGVTSVSNSNKA
jgi:hypothetical protein